MRGVLPVALLLAVAGCSSSGGTPAQPMTMRGSLRLALGDVYGGNPQWGTAGQGCAGTSGYDDIARGAGVTVYDDTGRIVGSGALSAGRIDRGSEDCVFTFTVAGLPSAGFYQVEVSHRGKVTFTRRQVAADRVALTLG